MTSPSDNPQLDLDTELDLETTSFDTWIRSLPLDPWQPAEEEAA
jgi:hypothetical protein